MDLPRILPPIVHIDHSHQQRIPLSPHEQLLSYLSTLELASSDQQKHQQTVLSLEFSTMPFTYLQALVDREFLQIISGFQKHQKTKLRLFALNLLSIIARRGCEFSPRFSPNVFLPMFLDEGDSNPHHPHFQTEQYPSTFVQRRNLSEAVRYCLLMKSKTLDDKIKSTIVSYLLLGIGQSEWNRTDHVLDSLTAMSALVDSYGNLEPFVQLNAHSQIVMCLQHPSDRVVSETLNILSRLVVQSENIKFKLLEQPTFEDLVLTKFVSSQATMATVLKSVSDFSSLRALYILNRTVFCSIQLFSSLSLQNDTLCLSLSTNHSVLSALTQLLILASLPSLLSPSSPIPYTPHVFTADKLIPADFPNIAETLHIASYLLLSLTSWISRIVCHPTLSQTAPTVWTECGEVETRFFWRLSSQAHKALDKVGIIHVLIRVIGDAEIDTVLESMLSVFSTIYHDRIKSWLESRHDGENELGEACDLFEQRRCLFMQFGGWDVSEGLTTHSKARNRASMLLDSVCVSNCGR
ncbi:hypothetical protein BLNAU_9175 [Blattamonas nauphoetae]|uniref:Uncharacterized protein n=1 Tax=Blattamonas nauphoetae TaxID=2049346 RepID=A0ABQ9XWH2_9EUKA|nr:hypothetical protein BLNAU_9175 [Blattamonas nauphoetae]